MTNTRAATVDRLSEILALTPDEINTRIDDTRAGPFANRPIAIDVPRGRHPLHPPERSDPLSGGDR